MRFTELLELGPTRKLININDSLFEQLVDGWTREMGEKKLFGYQKATRVEHFQEAVDTVYTTLEGELQTTDPEKSWRTPNGKSWWVAPVEIFLNIWPLTSHRPWNRPGSSA